MGGRKGGRRNEGGMEGMERRWMQGEGEETVDVDRKGAKGSTYEQREGTGRKKNYVRRAIGWLAALSATEEAELTLHINVVLLGHLQKGVPHFGLHTVLLSISVHKDHRHTTHGERLPSHYTQGETTISLHTGRDHHLTIHRERPPSLTPPVTFVITSYTCMFI